MSAECPFHCETHYMPGIRSLAVVYDPNSDALSKQIEPHACLSTLCCCHVQGHVQLRKVGSTSAMAAEEVAENWEMLQRMVAVKVKSTRGAEPDISVFNYRSLGRVWQVVSFW